ncbi:MAG: tetraacyldisaccharide 4'-kinase [Phycisphaerales bacterium]|nr:MAG: tetraacyldisaccharide 4'-kinase [Phycisphaerales bacterium]
MPDRDGPLPAALRPMARLAEAVYARAVARRNAAYDAQARGHALAPSRRTITLDRPVVSVGNLSVGGTGKTPAVQLICRWLLLAGHRPAIAMRGYGARRGLSDEAELHRAALPEVPLAVGPDRVGRIIELLASPAGQDVDVIVLDDGFQHRRLGRQLDVVLIDASRPVLDERLLPAGWLREPIDGLARAHAVVLTHADRADAHALAGLERALAERHPHLLLARARHAWQGLRLDVDPPGGAMRPIDWLAGRRYVLACAIGRPRAFIEQAERAFGPPTQAIVLRDHDPYRPGTVQRLRRACQGADALLVTEKDWTKLQARVRTDPQSDTQGWPCPIARPALSLEIVAGEQALRQRVLEAARWQDAPSQDDPSARLARDGA